FNTPPPPHIYTLSLHDALPISQVGTTTDIITGTVTGPDSQPLAGALVQATSLETQVSRQRTTDARGRFTIVFPEGGGQYQLTVRDRKSTRLNSSHVAISYAVFC